MISDTGRAVLGLAALAVLGACDTIHTDPNLSTFGEANRQTMAAQIVNPDPVYDTLNPPTSGEHAGQAGERYSDGRVIKPDAVSASSGPQ